MKSKIYLPKSYEELLTLTKDELQKLWVRYFKELPNIKNKMVVKIIWYKVQCENHNLKVKQKIITRLNSYMKNPEVSLKKAIDKKYLLSSGVELKKHYKGRDYIVKVSSDYYEYEGVKYKSLSAVGLVITGMRVNGIDFFGLNNKGVSNGKS